VGFAFSIRGGAGGDHGVVLMLEGKLALTAGLDDDGVGAVNGANRGRGAREGIGFGLCQ